MILKVIKNILLVIVVAMVIWILITVNKSDNEDEHKIHKNVQIVVSTGILMIDKQLYDNLNNLPNNVRNRIYIKFAEIFGEKFGR